MPEKGGNSNIKCPIFRISVVLIWSPEEVHGYCWVVGTVTVLSLGINVHFEADTVQSFISWLVNLYKLFKKLYE